MATIKVVNKSNQVLLILDNKTFLGDSDGDFVASVSSDVANGVDIVRSDDSFQICKDLDPDQIVGSDGNAFSSTAATAVSTLNSNHLNRGKSLFEVGVEDPGSGSLSKTTPDTKLQLKVKSDGSGFELVDKSSVLENIGGSALEFGSGDNQVLAWTLSKQLEGNSSTNVYRAAIRLV